MVPVDPPHDCRLCSRLAAFRDDNRKAHPDWFNGPVPVWSSAGGRLIIAGLAPGLKGANRTGRPFTGDYAGDLLYATLIKAGLAKGIYAASPDDGLQLTGAAIVNAVRCVPPQNKPTGAEIANCRPFFAAAIAAHDHAAVIVALGRIAHEQVLRTLGLRLADHPFAHGARHALADGRVLYDSYHCSRYNTNTGRLTTGMFEKVIFAAAAEARPASVSGS